MALAVAAAPAARHSGWRLSQLPNQPPFDAEIIAGDQAVWALRSSVGSAGYGRAQAGSSARGADDALAARAPPAYLIAHHPEVHGDCCLNAEPARLWRQQGVPAYVCGPSPASMGGRDEFVDIEDFLHILRTHATHCRRTTI